MLQDINLDYSSTQDIKYIIGHPYISHLENSLPSRSLKKSVGKLNLHINRHTDDMKEWGERIKRLKCIISLHYKVNKIGWPYGGLIWIEVPIDEYNHGFDVSITGRIRMPYFRYGVTVDEEWENELSKYPAPLMILDTGAQTMIIPSNKARNAVRLNEAMAFWRSTRRIFYSINEVTLIKRREDGRILKPLEFDLYTYVAYGAAYALVGGNLIHEPSWYEGHVGWENSIKWNCWGQLHEYGHHFQERWSAGNYGESTNNVLILIAYSMMCEMDSTRNMNLRKESTYLKIGHNNYCHQYLTIDDKEMLCLYGNNIYWFGADFFRKLLNTHINEKYFSRNDYGYYGKWLLHLCKMTQLDVRPYYKTYNGTDYLFFEENISQAVHDLIDSFHYNESHSIALLYQIGYVRNGEEIETAKPYEIPCRAPYVFDFVKYMKSAQGCHTFEFVSVEGGQDNFEKIGEGIYKYTPPDDINIIDKSYVNYRDTVNQYIYGHDMYAYHIERKNNNMYIEYAEMLSNLSNALFARGSEMEIEDPGQDMLPWIGMSDGSFYPERTSGKLP